MPSPNLAAPCRPPDMAASHTPPAHARTAFILALAAPAAVAAGWIILRAGPFGPLTRHMGVHFLLMNLAAPSLALAAVLAFGARAALTGTVLFALTAIQLALLWGWHVPAALSLAHAAPAVTLVMQGSLAATAFAFWLAVFSERGGNRWRAILALAVTGKLFCLLGVLLVFAPRLLYAVPAGHDPAGVAMLADQHLAGLMMLAVCPLTYVAAGVALSARWLWELDARAAPAGAADG